MIHVPLHIVAISIVICVCVLYKSCDSELESEKPLCFLDYSQKRLHTCHYLSYCHINCTPAIRTVLVLELGWCLLSFGTEKGRRFIMFHYSRTQVSYYIYTIKHL